MDWRQLQDETKNIYILGLGVPYIRVLKVVSIIYEPLPIKVLLWWPTKKILKKPHFQIQPPEIEGMVSE